MATEFKLSYTASDINERLGRIDNLAKKSDIPSKLSELTNDSSFATESYVNSAIANLNISDVSSAIIDVIELPTENINEDAFYRLLSGSLVINQVVQNAYTCHCVETLPSSGLPATNLDQTEGHIYYTVGDGELYGYVDDMLSMGLGVPVGWYPGATLLGALGFGYSGVITNIMDDPKDDNFRLLLEYVIYSYKDSWTSHKTIGWAGTGPSSEIFNDPMNIASGERSHAEGAYSHAEGYSSHAEGDSSHAEGDYSHAEGCSSHAEGYFSHAEGYSSHAEGYYSHAEGYSSHAEGDSSHAEGYFSHAEGYYSHAEGNYSHAEGDSSHAEGNYSHAEGDSSHAEGNSSHAEGYSSHAEGNSSHAEGAYSHAEGDGSYFTKNITGASASTVYTINDVTYLNVGASIRYIISDSKGVPTYNTAKIVSIDAINKTITVNRTLSADAALNNATVKVYISGLALGDNSHSEGNQTIAAGRSQHTQGEFNIIDPEYDVSNNGKRAKYAHIVGNGIDHNTRSNAHTLDWNGNAWFQGEVYVGGTGQDDSAAVKLAKMSDIPSTEGLATESYVNNAVASLVNSAPEALNTLDELAAALGDDSNFATTVTNQIAAKQDAITGTAGQFVVIGTNGKPTTKTILIAEEATF